MAALRRDPGTMKQDVGEAQFILAGDAAGSILATREPLSFWGGVMAIIMQFFIFDNS